MLSAAIAGAETGITGRHMDKYGPGLTLSDVLKRRRIHEQLPVVLVSGEIERHLVRGLYIIRQRPWRQQQSHSKAHARDEPRCQHSPLLGEQFLGVKTTSIL